MAAIWETVDRFGRSVSLSESRWDHIVAARSPHLLSPDAIRGIIEFPAEITLDADYAHRECFYSDRTFGLGLKVVVQFRPVSPQGTWVGAVITAYPSKAIKRTETRRWP